MRTTPGNSKDKNGVTETSSYGSCGKRLGNNVKKARQVYRTVIKPVMTYAAAIWHAPSGTTVAKMAHVKNLAIEQSGCLRTITGDCRATPMAVLEAGSSIPSIRIALDRTVFRMQTLRGIHPLKKIGNARCQKFCAKGGEGNVKASRS